MIYSLEEVPSQLLQVANWQFQEWGRLYPGQTLHDRTMQVQTHLVGNPIPSTYMAFDRDLLAGIVSLVVNDLAEQPGLTPWLASLYVAPQFRNKGHGSRLVEHAEKAAYDAGYDDLFLYTSTAFDYFVERRWEPIQSIPRPTGEIVVMQRDLTCYEDLSEDSAEPVDGEEQ